METKRKQVHMTAEKAEHVLFSRMKANENEFKQSLWQMARFYSTTTRQKQAGAYVRLIMGITQDLEEQASCWVHLGQLCEQVGDYKSAAYFYRQALSIEPSSKDTWYFINNNLGYSLIQLKKHSEAEKFCAAAINIDPVRPNAHKNLALALQGQGYYLEAALSFLGAIRANAADPRALGHLTTLMEGVPELGEHLPELSSFLREGRQAVKGFGIQLNGKYGGYALKNSLRKTHCEHILGAVDRLVRREGQGAFKMEDIQKSLELSQGEWRLGYPTIFQAMDTDQPQVAQGIRKKFRDVFQESAEGTHVLTKYGTELVSKIQDDQILAQKRRW